MGDPALPAFFASYARAWRANSAASIESHWELSEAPLYVAEEIDAPMNDWPALRAYWAHNEGFHQKIDLRFSKFQEKPIGAGARLVLLHMEWDIQFRAGASKAMGGDNRVCAALRETDAALKLVSWIEAPLAPITYMRRLYEQRATPGFYDPTLP